MRKSNAYALMVPIATTGRMAITTTMTVKGQSRPVGACTCIPRTTQLQQATICSNRNGIPCSCQTTQTTHIRTTLQKGIRNRSIVQTLPMPENLYERHAQHTCTGCSLVQTQIPDQPSSHPRRLDCCSHWWTRKNSHLKNTTKTPRQNHGQALTTTRHPTTKTRRQS